MANLTMTNWRIEDKLPYINLGSAGENNASIVTITVDALIDHASYYLDIGDESGSGLPNTQELTPSSNEGTNGEMVYTLSMQPMVTWLGKEGIKLLQVRCVYTEDDKQVVKESNVFHAKVDRNSGFVYKYDIAVFEEYLAKIKEGGGCSGEYVTEDELIEALRPYATETEVGDAITTALVPYPTTSEVESAISTALTPYPTKTEVNNTIDTALTPYAKTSEVSTAISDALTPYSTTSEMNTAINNALTPYSTTSEMNTAINNAVADKQDRYNDIRDNIPMMYVALNNAISSKFAEPNSYLVYDELNNVFLLTVEKRTHTSETQNIILKVIALSDRTKNINIKFYYQPTTSLENPQPLYFYVNGYVRVVQLSGEFANISFGNTRSNLPASTYTWEQYNPVTFTNQVIEMPTADILTLGNIYQYVGDTDANYTNGLFYECVSDGEATPTYSWVVKNVIDLPIAKGTGANSIIEGDSEHNIANQTYSHAEGYYTQARGLASHAEGNNAQANGQHSHAEGQNTIASNTNSHSEGQHTTASGVCSHVEGRYSNAVGSYSHAQNFGTQSQGFSQTTIGKYNILQGSPNTVHDTDYALIIGNGETNQRSNALAVQWDGTVVMQDDSTIKSAKTVYEVMGKMGAKNLLPFPYKDSYPKTSYDILYDVNSDTSISVSGTSLDWATTTLYEGVFKEGSYTISAKGLVEGLYLQVGKIVEGQYSIVTTCNFSSPEQDFSIDRNTTIRITIQVQPNKTLDNTIIYPMLRLADDQDPTWQPYAMTNKILTDKINSIKTIAVNAVDFADFQTQIASL